MDQSFDTFFQFGKAAVICQIGDARHGSRTFRVTVCDRHPGIFAELLEAIRTVAVILKHKPSAVEILDADVVVMARKNLSVAPLCSFIQGDPQAILVVEFFGETSEEAEQKMGVAWRDVSRRGSRAAEGRAENHRPL